MAQPKSKPTPTQKPKANSDSDSASDAQAALQEQVQRAYAAHRPLRIIGGASKQFYGCYDGEDAQDDAETLRTTAHCGIVDYDPAELVITARAGTRLLTLQKHLAAAQQMLGFEPPSFTPDATLGGAIATGFAGARRAFVGSAGGGAVRDFVLGVKIISANAKQTKCEVMRFGGQVMKNVAGFDIARLMVGALGTLGVLVEVSLRVSPQPQAEQTHTLAHAKAQDALALFNRLARKPLPISGAVWLDGETRIRLSGNARAVQQAAAVIGGEVTPHNFAGAGARAGSGSGSGSGSDAGSGEAFWRDLREQRLAFFSAESAFPLLRVSAVAVDALADLELELESELKAGAQLIDWGGAQRWIRGEVDVGRVREVIDALGGRGRGRGRGQVTQFRNAEPRYAVFHPQGPALRGLQLRLQEAFDPRKILNRRYHPHLYPPV